MSVYLADISVFFLGELPSSTMPRQSGELSHRLLAENPGEQFDWHIVHQDIPPDNKLDLLLERVKRRKLIQGIKDMFAGKELGFASKATGAPPARTAAPSVTYATTTAPPALPSPATSACAQHEALPPTPVFDRRETSSCSVDFVGLRGVIHARMYQRQH